MPWRVGVVGHSGYSGAELVRLLGRHGEVEVVLLDHREAGEAPRYISPERIERIPSTAQGAVAAGLDLVFLATAPDVSMELAPEMLDAGVRVIDLSGAFRLGTPENYERWYKKKHNQPALLAEAAYGLPEFYRAEIVRARLVSNPGCYPTAANLAIRPLIEHRLIDRAAGIVCDAKSGVSGAGRKPSLKTSFCEVTENFSAYAVLEHRHIPEVLMNSGLIEPEFSFTAQLLPLKRGILETIYFRAMPELTLASLLQTYTTCYGSEPFVRLQALGSSPNLHDVAHTNYCDLALHLDERTGRGVIISAIDNLGKGAAGQAIQNMNLLFGLPETAGLL